MSELIIASHNHGKVREIAELLAPHKVLVTSAAEHHLPEPEETGDTFEANAALKAEAACQVTGKACLADDSGLCVNGLNDAPGIYSARWAGPEKDFAMAMQQIHDQLKEKGEQPEGAAAYFVCVLALALPNEETRLYRGEVHGTLSFPPRGEHGFGYDPIFIPADDNPDGETFGEMNPAAKHRMSHRARAFEKFVADLNW
ncbi:MAG: non-canonical purine NTP pyrophosphatase, RdgB/HAM1 family [Rickettsiales bacterium]|nr:non-canonical purine NTP pyrophosphatase, RdgB/HAM1 family [Rickettsiales bacterium]